MATGTDGTGGGDGRQRRPGCWRIGCIVVILLFCGLFLGAWLVLFPPQRNYPDLEVNWASEWFEGSGVPDVVTTAEGMFVQREYNRLRAWDVDGNEAWQREVHAVHGQLRWEYGRETGIVLFDNSHTLLSLDPLDGSTRWRVKIPAGQSAGAKLARLNGSPQGKYIAASNDGWLAMYDADGELVADLDCSVLSAPVWRPYPMDDGRLVIGTSAQRGSFGYERLLEDGGTEPAFTGLTGTFRYGQQTWDGNFLFSSRSGNTASQTLLDANGKTLASNSLVNYAMNMLSNAGYTCWIDGGTILPESSVGRMDNSDRAITKIDTGNFSPERLVALDDDGSILLVGTPGRNNWPYFYLSTWLARMRMNLYSFGNLSELLPRERPRGRNIVMRISPDGEQRIYEAGEEMIVVDGFTNELQHPDKRLLYAVEYETDSEGRIDVNQGRRRIVQLAVPAK